MFLISYCVFVPGRTFQPSLMAVRKTGAYLSVKHLDLITNIRLGWKGLPRTNTLAYYEQDWDRIRNLPFYRNLRMGQ
jgi:hypothetical protein